MSFWSVAQNILILSALLIGGLACGFEAIYEIKQGGKWRIWENISIGLLTVYAALVVMLTMH